MARIRTLNFLPEIFQTPINAEFLAATLDQIVNPPNTTKIQGYVGSKFGYGINATNKYVTEPTKTRTDYQLEPGVVFTKTNESVAQDFITYPGILDSIAMQDGLVDNNSRLFKSPFYSWDSFTNLDKLINFNEYYWLPVGPPAVTVATQPVFSKEEYIVTPLANGYEIQTVGEAGSSINPTLTFLRGGTYSFIVNQDSEFWIQTLPGVSGVSPVQPNLSTRDVYGVQDNGSSQGIVVFNVPEKDAQNDFLFPGNNTVDLISTKAFSEINGQVLNTFVDPATGVTHQGVNNIDGITSLEGLTVMFYGANEEVGYVSSYYGDTTYDVNDPAITDPVTAVVASTSAGYMSLAPGYTTDSLVLNQTITFDGPTIGGVNIGQVYFVSQILNSTDFVISDAINGATIVLTPETGTMVANINQGQYQQGYYTTVSDNFYRIQYVGDTDNPTLRLVPIGSIPINQKITPIYGTTWNNRPFYKNVNGIINPIPPITATLDVLYYQDSSVPNRVGKIRIIDSNTTNTINVETDILGRKNYTAPNGVVFTNGLKVSFDGDVIPANYLQGEYYVEGVGTSIELIPVQTLVVPEKFTRGEYIPYDTTNYAIGNYDSDLNIPVEPDYITIARNSISKNAWSRSNRWFHIDVINATASYNNDPSIATRYATQKNKAVRPIIEFYPNLKLFNSGHVGENAVDFIDTRATDALSTVAGSTVYYPDVEVYTQSTASINAVIGTATTITVNAADVVGTLQVGMYIADSSSVLPAGAQIDAITGTTTLTIDVSWPASANVPSVTDVSLVGSDTTLNQYAVFPESRIIFAADKDVNVRNKIYVVNFSQISPNTKPVITLTVAPNGNVVPDEQVVVKRGYNYQGVSFYYNGLNWKKAQQKVTVNQPLLFDVFDKNGISFGDADVYQSTTFKGCKLFGYQIDINGIDDPVLGFPIRYSSDDNAGDISFDVSLNVDTFDYVTGTSPVNQKVNTGYVYNYTSAETFERQLGWQTAVADSAQYQIFQFNYDPLVPTVIYECDIAPLPDLDSELGWPRVKVFVNNVYQNADQYVLTTTANSTLITLNTLPTVETVVQVLILSDQVSKTAYYEVPINLSNNPFNADLTTVNIGDIRSQYQDIFINAPNTTGDIFGANNYRDCGDLVPYGTAIIQNSSSLVLPGSFFRKKEHNLFDALLFNSREYIKYKQLLVDTVQNTDYTQRLTPAQILDNALDQVTAARSEINAFFWSDMLPSKAPYRSNTYNFNNDLDTSIYPLSQVYNFESANYNGVLVYLTRTVNGLTLEKQLTKDVDYTISTEAPSLTVTLDLLAGDKVTIKEYNQTYGSYVPNTPTKLGLYPSFYPEVVLDSDYLVPTYFIKGHDGSYTKLYGKYNVEFGVLEDIRDQALLEFELRIYNNLKLSENVPITKYEVVPGYFRQDTSTYTWNEFITMYSPLFLDWVGQNRLDYKTQYFTKNNEYSYNYTNSGNKLDKAPIQQGFWRGVYDYFYDTTAPNLTPWEMLGLTEKPSWWNTRYGPAPYTSDNLILWGDLEAGYIWNNGNPYINPKVARPGLSKIIPVDTNGNLVSPLLTIVGNYNPSTFQKDWVVGDMGPVELSYRRSSTWPFDLMRLFALTRPAEFFNLAVDLDNYKYSPEFNQYLVDNRSHLVPANVEIYGNGIAKTSYINWIVDYEKQLGVDATANIKTMLNNLDVRLVYRLAGYSDKTMLNFYVEKGSPNSKNASLLIPDESYSILLYDNQPFDRIVYSGVIVQKNQGFWTVYGNSQSTSYFVVYAPINNGLYDTVDVLGTKVKFARNYSTNEVIVPYGTKFYSIQEVVQFLMSYNAALQDAGMLFNQIEQGIEVTWQQMAAEFVYWTLTGWEVGSVLTLNPAATEMNIDKESTIVQPLTVQQSNFILNQNLYPIQITDLCIDRQDTLFHVHTLNEGDAMSYAQFNVSNFEHGIVFDNMTLFNDEIYNLITGLRQNRIYARGVKTAEWNGTVNAYGFILNQDNVQEWNSAVKYTKGVIVKYKNKYWTSLKVIEPSAVFNQLDWKVVDYENIQKGLLPNASTRAFESTLYYDINQANLEQDADLLGFSLIGYRPRDYLALVDLTDTTQINVYKNLIKNKGTRNATDAFQGANLPQGGIKYDLYENWAIKSGEYGGVLNENFVEFRVKQTNLTGDPSIVSLTEGTPTVGSMQEIPLYSLFNYGREPNSPDILTTLDTTENSIIYPSAGYVNVNDVKMSSYYFAGLPGAVDSNGTIVPIQNFYAGEYFWLANFKNQWNVFKWNPIGQVIQVRNNTNGTATVTFNVDHNLAKLDPISIINFANNVDGYYIVTEVLSTTEVIINLSVLGTSLSTIQGNGIGLSFDSQRVATAAEIAQLNLTSNEFVKNTVWVDEDNDGSWAVYRKSLNYQYQKQIERDDASKLGSAVAYTQDMGYLVSDPTYSEDGITVTGRVYRYTYDALNERYVSTEIQTGGPSFGSAIAYAQNFYFVSEPTSGTPKVYVYALNNTIVTDDMLLCQEISAPAGVTDWGSTIAVSDDTNWLYISSYKPDTDPSPVNNSVRAVYVYRKQNVPLSAGSFVSGQTYVITSLGNTDFTLLGAVDNKVGITFVADFIGSDPTVGTTGTATQITYEYSTVIDGADYGCVSGDNFGKSIAVDADGSTVVISAPDKDFNETTLNWGTVYALQRTVQNFESQFSSQENQPITFPLAWTPAGNLTYSSTQVITGNKVVVDSLSYLNDYIGYPVVFAGVSFGESRINPYTVYYIYDASSTGTNWVQLALTREATSPIQLDAETGLDFNLYVQADPLYVSRNGTLVNDNSYAVIDDNLIYYSNLLAGDIINVSGNQFFLEQEFTTPYTNRTNLQFGYSVEVDSFGSMILVGSPYEIDNNNQEGAVYNYVDGGSRYGVVIGSQDCNVTTNRTILINGYSVVITPGNAAHVAGIINNNNITNVEASYTSDNKLIVQVVNQQIALINEKLKIVSFDGAALQELGLVSYTNTQVIKCPHGTGQTRFGSVVKMNEAGSIVVSAPVATRFEGTFFDFTDDENLDNDTVFDNNATRFVESYANAGAVYMYDYLSEYNENLIKPGAFVYAQSVNSQTLPYSDQPLYGTAVDFNDNRVVVGSPNFYPTQVGGQVVVYNNATGIRDWSVFRKSAPIVDINKIQNTQIFSASTNNTLVNLDYMDPLQGKLLGAIRENIDFVAGTDPARYNSDLSTLLGSVWGEEQVGRMWLDTSNIRWLNYHQNDVVYNAKHWGSVFPGSDVAVYTWVASFVPPAQYPGPGAVYDSNLFTVSTVLNASNVAVPVYYFWVRNTNIIFEKLGKTLSDAVVASYIANPRSSGIAYMSPLLPNTFALYNSIPYFNDNDSVFHIGYANGTTDDVLHQEYSLIRENYADDFLPGIPRNNEVAHTLSMHGMQSVTTEIPYSLYGRMLDSLAGCDGSGAVVPNPFLPLAVQSGVLARPRQSFFYNRFLALKNYLTYANDVLAQFPITELRPNATYLFMAGEVNPSTVDNPNWTDGTQLFYDTTDYWEYVNWWAAGYNNNTKSALQVPAYADLAELTVANGTIVTVEQNGNGKFEVYVYDAATNNWTRIGLENGTIAFKTSLWDYAAAKTGYGDNFFDTTVYDLYPSEETRWIVRALTEQIYTNELLIYRNKSLILLFEYIQSETTESQNFLPWLNKTSLADVAHTIRELKPYEVFQTDNQEFLEGYINEVKPYHVVIKDFLFKYTGQDVFEGDITDFDLPATYNSSYDKYISPQLVYNDPAGEYEYTASDAIWSEGAYSQWFANHGLSLVGQDNFNITILKSYVDRSSNFLIVDNAQGFPTTGTIKIGEEQIGYSNVDRALNILTGLVRGVNGTVVSTHVPNSPIFIDLPAVLVLNGGHDYVEPPKVSAVINTAIYPEPTRPAVLEAVMNLDSVLQVNVIDPGQGYAVLPEIVIDAATQLIFADTDIDPILHTIRLYAPTLKTGDIVRYVQGTTGKVGRLENEQWYYVNVLETVPTAIVGLYTTYSNALNDKNRVQIYADGTATDMTLNLGARATAVTSSSPVRENNITLRFDRTTYGSQVKDWEAGAYYGSFFAGTLDSSTNMSSSSISLESTQPPIDSILASSQAVSFEIAKAENDQLLEWSSFVRYVSGTLAVNDSITLIPQDDGSSNPNASGTTIGFYVGMPVKFSGTVFGGLIDNETYYVKDILDEFSFTVSDTINGPTYALTDSTAGVYTMECYVGEVTNTAVLTLNYPGILQVTATEAITNMLTVPTSLIGTGGTSGFYTNLPIFFTDGGFGGITENQIYYITTVVDNETFTMSLSMDPVQSTVYATDAATDRVTISSVAGFSINDSVIFTDMVIDSESVEIFGNIRHGKIYYVSAIYASTNEISLSEVKNGATLSLTTVLANNNTSAQVTNQKDTVALTTATGSMTMNVALPISPGQIDGQKFTLYQTSGQYPNYTVSPSEVSALITRPIMASFETVNRLAISQLAPGGAEFFYTNLPIEFSDSIGGLSANTTYYVRDFTGQRYEDPENPGTYLTRNNIQVNVVTTTSSGYWLECDTVADSVDSIYVNMPITFSGQSLGGILIGETYYVKEIDIPNNRFRISEVPNGSVFETFTSNGVMLGTGDPFITVSATVDGPEIALTSSTTTVTMTQVITEYPEIDLSYVRGGYQALITTPGAGFAINNVITIPGTATGGTSPTNDITLIVNTVNSIGGVTDFIVYGIVPAIADEYYFKVISTNKVEVYANPLLTVPVSGIDFPYTGFTTTTVTETQASNDTISVISTAGFNVNDAVVFKDSLSSGIVPNKVYYIVATNFTSTTFQISENPGGAVLPLITATDRSYSVTKVGSYAVLPEPFYFDQSIVKFNNRVYICVVSNNDKEFVFGKWELLDSADRRLNAMDRTISYYQPTVNMPGVDLTQLFEGVTYPNSIYKGNAFEPDQQFTVDTVLQDQPFYPTEVDITSVLYDGSKYIATANLPTYSALLGSTAGDTWAIAKLTGAQVGVSDIVYANGLYVMTSTNPATPVFRSNDGVTWTTNGYYTPYGTQGYDTTNYDMTSISIASLSLQSVAYGNGVWVAVGDNIVVSSDTYTWREVSNFNPTYKFQLYGISYVTTSAFTGFIAVGKGLRPDYTTGITELVPTNLIFTSVNGVNWVESPSLTSKGLNGISSNGEIAIATGEDGVIYYTQNGADWLGVNEVSVISVNASNDVLNVTNTAGFSDFAQGTPVKFTSSFSSIVAGTTYYVKEIISSTQVTLSTTLNGSVLNLVVGTPAPFTMMYAATGVTPSLQDLTYANDIWLAVGDAGTIRTSSDGIVWNTKPSGTVENLNGITYNSTANTFTVVGDNNTILTSTDGLGTAWVSTSLFVVEPTVYDVQGAEFSFGYAPEELVAGVVTDNLAMTVTTRPGSNWPVVEYSHYGFGAVSLELAPEFGTQTTYSFARAVEVAAKIAVQIINPATGLGTTIFEGTDYTVDWVGKTVTLTNPLSLSPAQILRIDVYQVGNGDQLVNSSTDIDPIRTNSVTGFNEIYVNCNYTGAIYQGGGVIQPGSSNIEVRVTKSDSETNRLTCDDVSKFVLNAPVSFQGALFGGVQDDVTYFIKSINPATNTITISGSVNETTGVAGPVFRLTTATGEMYVNIQTGNGLVWTDPIMYHNGTKLVLGATNIVTRTKSINNSITTNSTAGLTAGTRIVFSDTMFGGVILPMTTYYISSIIDSNEFTVSETLGGPTLELNDATGGAIFITNDYAFGIQPNGISAKIVFATDSYSVANDYIVYTLFGETPNAQVGYSIPEIQYFAGNGSQAAFYLNNYIGGDNIHNAVVEIDGVRITSSRYTISNTAPAGYTGTLLITPPPAAGTTVSIMTYNDTTNQYLTSQYGITGNPGSSLTTLTVESTTTIIGRFDQDTPTVQAYDQTNIPSGPEAFPGPTILYDENLSWMTLASPATTASLNINDPLVFSAPAIGGIEAGKTYYVVSILNSTDFVVSESVGGPPFVLTNATGSMDVVANGLTVAPIASINNSLTPPLASTFATETSSTGNLITAASVKGFVVGQPVQFFGIAPLGNLQVDGTVYFINWFDTLTNTFIVQDQYGNQIDPGNAVGNIIVQVGGLSAVRVTTTIPHNFVENTMVRIDGTTGSVQLNNNAFYAKVINDVTFDLYQTGIPGYTGYNPEIGAVNYPVTTIDAYTGGGYTWRAGLFYAATTYASEINNNEITVDSVDDLIIGTPVYFTQVETVYGSDLGFGGLISGTEYYVKEITSAYTFTVSDTRYGDVKSLTNYSGGAKFNVTQWSQQNVDRLWVTVNGLRVASSSLRINPSNEISILTEMQPGDQVIITNMINHATPNQTVYMNLVDKNGISTVYRSNHLSQTWLTQPVYDLSSTIYVQDVTNLTDQITQTSIVPASSLDGFYYVGINADKRTLTSVNVYNETTSQLVESAYYEVVLVNTAPTLKFVAGSPISKDDTLIITMLEGNIIYVNGEQIRFSIVDFENNSLSGLERGVNGTSPQFYIPAYTPVFSFLENNRLADVYYNQTWNSYNFNPVLGDPLQLSNTTPAVFLNTDIT